MRAVLYFHKQSIIFLTVCLLTNLSIRIILRRKVKNFSPKRFIKLNVKTEFQNVSN